MSKTINEFAKDIMKWELIGDWWKISDRKKSVHKDYIQEEWNPFTEIEDAIDLASKFKSYTITYENGLVTCLIFYCNDGDNKVYRQKASGSDVQTAICNCASKILNSIH